MKKILITGVNSFIGNSFEKWIKERYNSDYLIHKISLRGKSSSEVDFSAYDTVLYVTGIAHADTNKNDTSQEKLYYDINTNLTLDMAEKAKSDGVKQFIFLSSIIVYGNSAPVGEKKVIDSGTDELPAGFYGESKLRADRGLIKLKSEYFKTAIIRPPMIYGKGSKGNYPRLSRLAAAVPIFPDIDNERSMLFIDNLSEFIRLVIDNNTEGVLYPQNKEYVKTSDLVREIAKQKGKKIYFTKIFNPLIIFMSKRIGTIGKIFGNLVYDKCISNYFDYSYCVYSFEESIKRTED